MYIEPDLALLPSCRCPAVVESYVPSKMHMLKLKQWCDSTRGLWEVMRAEPQQIGLFGALSVLLPTMWIHSNDSPENSAHTLSQAFFPPEVWQNSICPLSITQPWVYCSHSTDYVQEMWFLWNPGKDLPLPLVIAWVQNIYSEFMFWISGHQIFVPKLG